MVIQDMSIDLYFLCSKVFKRFSWNGFDVRSNSFVVAADVADMEKNWKYEVTSGGLT